MEKIICLHCSEYKYDNGRYRQFKDKSNGRFVAGHE